MSKPLPRIPMYPRDGPGSFEVIGGTGPITTMVSCGKDFLEIYKTDRTFRSQSPESVDPGRTNPNAPWVHTQVAEVGSSNPIVARLFIQSSEMLKSNIFAPTVNRDAAVMHMHACKESLLAADAIAKDLGAQINATLAHMRENLTEYSSRRTVALPQVQDLESKCASFLVLVNRTIKRISEIPNFFLRLDRRHSNFKDLGNALSGLLGEKHLITDFVRGNGPQLKHFIDLRNFHEHPKKSATSIRNFYVLPDGGISAPTWQVVGEQEGELGFIQQEMAQGVELLLGVGEWLFLLLIDHQLAKESRLRGQLEKIPEAQINPDLAIRYRIQFYLPNPPAATPA